MACQQCGSGTITITWPRDLRLNEASFDIGAGTLDIEKNFLPRICMWAWEQAMRILRILKQAR